VEEEGPMESIDFVPEPPPSIHETGDYDDDDDDELPFLMPELNLLRRRLAKRARREMRDVDEVTTTATATTTTTLHVPGEESFVMITDFIYNNTDVFLPWILDPLLLRRSVETRIGVDDEVVVRVRLVSEKDDESRFPDVTVVMRTLIRRDDETNPQFMFHDASLSLELVFNDVVEVTDDVHVHPMLKSAVLTATEQHALRTAEFAVEDEALFVDKVSASTTAPPSVPIPEVVKEFDLDVLGDVLGEKDVFATEEQDVDALGDVLGEKTSAPAPAPPKRAWTRTTRVERVWPDVPETSMIPVEDLPNVAATVTASAETHYDKKKYRGMINSMQDHPRREDSLFNLAINVLSNRNKAPLFSLPTEDNMLPGLTPERRITMSSILTLDSTKDKYCLIRPCIRYIDMQYSELMNRNMVLKIVSAMYEYYRNVVADGGTSSDFERSWDIVSPISEKYFKTPHRKDKHITTTFLTALTTYAISRDVPPTALYGMEGDLLPIYMAAFPAVNKFARDAAQWYVSEFKLHDAKPGAKIVENLHDKKARLMIVPLWVTSPMKSIDLGVGSKKKFEVSMPYTMQWYVTVHGKEEWTNAQYNPLASKPELYLTNVDVRVNEYGRPVAGVTIWRAGSNGSKPIQHIFAIMEKTKQLNGYVVESDPVISKSVHKMARSSRIAGALASAMPVVPIGPPIGSTPPEDVPLIKYEDPAFDDLPSEEDTEEEEGEEQQQPGPPSSSSGHAGNDDDDVEFVVLDIGGLRGDEDDE